MTATSGVTQIAYTQPWAARLCALVYSLYLINERIRDHCVSHSLEDPSHLPTEQAGGGEERREAGRVKLRGVMQRGVRRSVKRGVVKQGVVKLRCVKRRCVKRRGVKKCGEV